MHKFPQPESLTFAVIGGSGFLGRYVVQRLAQWGVRVRVITRHHHDARPLASMGKVGQIAYVPQDLTHFQGTKEGLKGCHGIINLAGILYEKGSQTFKKVHETVAQTLAQAAHELNITCFVQVSALGACENSPSRYAQSKARGEKLVQEILPKATILRPSILFGPEDDFFNRFAQMACLLPVLPIVGGSTLFQPVYVDNVAQAILYCLKNSSTQGCLYELGGPQVLSLKHLMEKMLACIHRPKKIINLPLPLANIIGFIGQYLPTPPLTLDQVALLQKDNITSNYPGLKDLGIIPTPVDAVIPSYLKRFQPND